MMRFFSAVFNLKLRRKNAKSATRDTFHVRIEIGQLFRLEETFKKWFPVSRPIHILKETCGNYFSHQGYRLVWSIIFNFRPAKPARFSFLFFFWTTDIPYSDHSVHWNLFPPQLTTDYCFDLWAIPRRNSPQMVFTPRYTSRLRDYNVTCNWISQMLVDSDDLWTSSAHFLF